ncbi:MAG: aminotransferase class I/II-fold pyridoxal phosphate-dependent enzyme [Clostridiales bacterium]|nr:aminotransferase class I/II-fold pyridoxal phosphate-dependent enzyme [Clostridiales bacterium]
MKLAEMSKQEQSAMYGELKKAYADYQARALKLNMSRGKPGADQLALAKPMLEPLEDYKAEDGTDTLNYGVLEGIPEARRLFGELMDMPPAQVIIGGNSSLSFMYDAISRLFCFGFGGNAPWCKLDKVKFLCPAPGYDRHFTICEVFGIEMIPIAMGPGGPDMDEIERLAATDASIKGMWCVPQYSNPDGITYSKETVRRLGALKTAAPDFRIFWDNAYCVHHLDMDDRDTLDNIYTACKNAGQEDKVYMFASFSKISFPHGGISAMAASEANIAHTKKYLNAQTISYDKINQLRHARFFKDKAGVQAHMAKHAGILAPKFSMVLDSLEKELTPLGIGHWTKPKGGYFVSVFLPKGCAKRTVELCKQAGVELTGAGAPYPYGKDPQDSNIRIAPSFPPVAELAQAMEVFCLCAKMAAIEALG